MVTSGGLPPSQLLFYFIECPVCGSSSYGIGLVCFSLKYFFVSLTLIIVVFTSEGYFHCFLMVLLLLVVVLSFRVRRCCLKNTTQSCFSELRPKYYI